ncbi:MAG: hypothetical protein M0T74_17860 [Desulfitobacterium hafniense]|nr:hypothetical protein [Desulfitobacterium hafniense]
MKMRVNDYSETISKMSETEAKKALATIYSKLSNIGLKGYSSEKCVKDIHAIYDRKSVEHLFETTDYVKTPKKFY